MIEVLNLTFSYGNGFSLEGITFKAYPGEILSILGPNGSGKSTLLKLISGILKKKGGKIYIFNRDVDSLDREFLNNIISYLPQDLYIPGILTVYEFILLGLSNKLGLRVKDKYLKEVDSIIEKLGIENLSEKYINEISGGQRRIVEIAWCLVRKPKILLLDEPISGLDIRNRIKVMEIIRRITIEEKITTIVVLHDLNTALRFSDRIMLLSNGRKVFEGRLEEFLGRFEEVERHYKIRLESNINEFPYVLPINYK